MPVLKPRNRLVYFRVSEDEFQEFTRVCESGAARSISDLARSATKLAATGANGGADEPVAVRLRKLDDLIGELALRVDQLAALVQGHAGNGKPVERQPYQSVTGRANAESA